MGWSGQVYPQTTLLFSLMNKQSFSQIPEGSQTSCSQSVTTPALSPGLLHLGAYPQEHTVEHQYLLVGPRAVAFCSLQHNLLACILYVVGILLHWCSFEAPKFEHAFTACARFKYAGGVYHCFGHSQNPIFCRSSKMLLIACVQAMNQLCSKR